MLSTCSYSFLIDNKIKASILSKTVLQKICSFSPIIQKITNSLNNKNIIFFFLQINRLIVHNTLLLLHQKYCILKYII